MLTRLPESGDAYLTYAVQGKVTTEQVRFVQQDMEAAAAGGRGARVLLKVEDLGGVTPGAVWQDLSHVADYVRHLDRIAVVGESTLISVATKAANLLPKTKARFFTHEETDAAREWLRE
jgi:hypothetical protein